MLTINDNISALGAANNLNQTNMSLSNVVSQLSSGMQIQTAADNPSGYAIAQSLQYEINGYGAGISNAQNAVSLLQTAQGAINQQESILQQMNTIATQSATSNVQLDATAANANQSSFNALATQLTQIANSTEYSGISLLSASSTNLTFQVGPSDTSNDQVTVTLTQTTASGLSVSGLSVTNVASAAEAISAVQAAINSLASTASALGATQNQIQSLANNITVAQQNLSSAHASLVDVNVAAATSQYTSLNVLEQSGASVLAQAQQLPNLALKLIQNA